MAITIQLLSDKDILQPTDWLRPLASFPNSFGVDSSINSFSVYSGAPINHFKWVRASDVIGDVWMGKSIQEIEEGFKDIGGFSYEVVRGDLPKSHIWDWRKDKPT